MNPWKAAALIVPAGLVLGMTAGAASRPVMVQNAKDYWPASVEEHRTAYEAPRPIYEGGPQDLTPASYSYRPDLDYSAYAWPDQEEPVYLAPALDEPAMDEAVDNEAAPVPEVHRAGAVEAVADRAEAAAEDAMAAAAGPDVAVASAPAPVQTMKTVAF